MAVSNVVETVLKLRGSREFQSQAKESAKGLLGIGDAGDKAGKKAAGGWKGVAKWAGGAAVIGGAATYVKSAADETKNLAKQTMGLQRVTGMDTKVASEWAAVLKVRGIDTGKFNVGMVTLSKQMVGATKGNAKAQGAFSKLGVSMESVKAGDTSAVLMQMADGLSKITNPAEKAAYAAQLLGKQGQALTPLLNSGSGALQEQLDMANQYGATLDGNATDAVKDQIAAQREWDMAMLGLKVQMGTGLLPVLSQVAGALSKLLGYLKPLISNSTVLQGTIVVLTAAFTAYKLAAFLSSLATMGLNKAFLAAKWGAIQAQLAMWGLNASVLLIPLAIAAVVLGVVILYKKWGWFHDAVQKVWGWIKKNWPMLLAMLTGPIGLAVLVIVKNFDKIKAAARAVVDFVKRLFGTLKDVVSNIFSGAGGFVANIGRAIADWINAHTPFGDQVKVGPLDFRIPALAEGGTMRSSGLALVGERGPEVVALPGRSTVYPNPGVAPLSAPPSLEAAGNGAGQTIITKVYLDRRQIAEAVGSYAADKRARR